MVMPNILPRLYHSGSAERALSKLCKEELDTLTVDKLESILAFANKAASITTSRHGAIPAMPTLAEVEG